MVTLKEAYFIAKRNSRHQRLYSCSDLGDCWQFGFVWDSFDPSDPTKDMPIGDGIPTVDRETGRYWEYQPPMDRAALLRRKSTKIPVEELTKYDAEFEETYK
jgi:hypothetical protein